MMPAEDRLRRIFGDFRIGSGGGRGRELPAALEAVWENIFPETSIA